MNTKIYKYFAYNRLKQERVEIVTLTVAAFDEDEAIRKAAKLIDRKYYELFEIVDDGGSQQ